MTEPAELPAFETVYLEFQPRKDSSAELIAEVHEYFSSNRLAGVVVAGSEFGLSTPVIAKLAMTMVDDSALVYEVDESGNLRAGRFTGDVCEDLARTLNTDVIADEYVLYSPGKEDGAVDFVELDPRRQTIDQPAGFPNEWRVSPQRLDSHAIVYTDARSTYTAQAIARDAQTAVATSEVELGQLIKMPSGVVELPLIPSDNKNDRVVLLAQAGNAKYVHLVMGKPKKQLRLTIANLPRFVPSLSAKEGTVGHSVLSLMSNAGLVAGHVQFDHPNFPIHILPLYERLTNPENTHSFFSEVAEILLLPAITSAVIDGQFAFPAKNTIVSPDESTHKPKKFGLFRNK